MRDQRNSTRVIVTDTGGVTLGSETDKFGFALAAKPPPGWFDEELKLLALTSELFGKEIYRSEGSFDVSLAVAGQATKGAYAQKRYIIIYEWSGYGTISVKEQPAKFSVIKGDYGFAVRLVLDVEIRETEATAKLALGPGNLDAALALGVATVSARLQTLGTTASFLPDQDIDIRSATDLTEATQRFHAAGQRLERKLAECGKVVAFDQVTHKQIDPVEPPPAFCGTIAKPAMLAYVSFGDGIGDRLREYQLISAECNAYRANLQGLAMKRAASKDAELSDSETKQEEYLEWIFADCGKRLASLDKNATEAEAMAEASAEGKTEGNEKTK